MRASVLAVLPREIAGSRTTQGIVTRYTGAALPGSAREPVAETVNQDDRSVLDYCIGGGNAHGYTDSIESSG